MSINSKTARLAGLLYLIVVLGGILSLAYVPGVTETSKDGAMLAATIRSHEALFRIGIAAGLICYTAFLILPLILWRLLAPFGQNAAIAMVALATTSVPIAFSNMVYRMNVLSLLGDEPSLAGLTTGQMQMQLLLSLESYWNGIFILKIFWGLWLLPFGWLLFRSQLVPRVFGILLMAGCFGYLIAFFGRLLVPEFTLLPFVRYISLPGSIGEIGTCLWLLTMGIRERPTTSS
ncbi:MAG: DUF4386 domain-containing protein [Sphingomonadales bacterium]